VFCVDLFVFLHASHYSHALDQRIDGIDYRIDKIDKKIIKIGSFKKGH